MAQGRQEGPREVLRARGLRYSRPREVILGFLLERNMHVNAEGLYLALKQQGEDLSLSTVYLNLGVLKDAGLIREFDGLNGEALYDSNINPHHHLICKHCGAIMDLPVVEIEGVSPTRFLRESAQRTSGWQVDEPDLNLKGICPACQRVL